MGVSNVDPPLVQNFKKVFLDHGRYYIPEPRTGTVTQRPDTALTCVSKISQSFTMPSVCPVKSQPALWISKTGWNDSHVLLSCFRIHISVSTCLKGTNAGGPPFEVWILHTRSDCLTIHFSEEDLLRRLFPSGKSNILTFALIFSQNF